jgi:sec-independent protein translocase protein TatB
MLDVGFSEILLTSAIALIVLGPERLPKVARQVGNWMGRARAMARQLSEQLEREVNADELLKLQNKPLKETPKAATATAAALDNASAPANAIGLAPGGGHSPVGANSPAIAPGAAGETAHAAPPAPAAATPDPVYGLAASATTAAAMHASDPPVVDNKPPNE